ncbi:putative centrosomal protein [Apostichopus japonicus]|uniref:Putative centrosomal protein n=1 Tax=Stichopus japonicus TaxID=307972 RepID=A0A2G8KFJ9_STIJA|nr:putative centrosomal protein [Apostichopus japonicus]
MATVSDELDDEFDKFLLEMKPFVLQLPHKSDRQRCALWIKKLCEPTGHGITGRKNRNMYAKLLLHMLKKALIEGPFSHKPDPGPLPTLPDYMPTRALRSAGQSRLEVPITKTNSFGNRAFLQYILRRATQTKSPRLREEGYHSLPDWVDTELVNSGRTNPRASRTRQRLFDSDIGKLSSPDVTETGSLGMHERKSSLVNHSLSSSSSSDDHQVFSHKDTHIKYQQKDSVSLKYSPKQSTVVDLPDPDGRPGRRSERRDKVEKQTIPDSKPKHRLTLENKQGSSKFTEEAAQVEREVELRTKLLETRFHEEKLIIQQRHDEAIQKILDRKNAEIEEMKHQYRSKTKDLEETNKKLERKVHSATRDVASVKETKDKQIRELRKMLEQTNQTSQNHFEKMLQGALADIEQEKFEMQKEHTKGIQDILEDTNIRLQKMEMEYNEQVDKHVSHTGVICLLVQCNVRQNQGYVFSMWRIVGQIALAKDFHHYIPRQKY